MFLTNDLRSQVDYFANLSVRGMLHDKAADAYTYEQTLSTASLGNQPLTKRGQQCQSAYSAIQPLSGYATVAHTRSMNTAAWMKSIVCFAIQAPMVFATKARTRNTNMVAVPINACFVVQQLLAYVTVAHMENIKSNRASRLPRSARFEKAALQDGGRYTVALPDKKCGGIFFGTGFPAALGTLHHFISRSSSGFTVHGVRFNRALLIRYRSLLRRE